MLHGRHGINLCRCLIGILGPHHAHVRESGREVPVNGFLGCVGAVEHAQADDTCVNIPLRYVHTFVDCGEGPWQVLVVLLVHLLLADNLLGDPEMLSSAFKVTLRGRPCRLETSLDASIASPRGGNIGPFLVLRLASLAWLLGVSCHQSH